MGCENLFQMWVTLLGTVMQYIIGSFFLVIFLRI